MDKLHPDIGIFRIFITFKIILCSFFISSHSTHPDHIYINGFLKMEIKPLFEQVSHYLLLFNHRFLNLNTVTVHW